MHAGGIVVNTFSSDFVKKALNLKWPSPGAMNIFLNL